MVEGLIIEEQGGERRRKKGVGLDFCFKVEGILEMEFNEMGEDEVLFKVVADLI